MKIVGRKFRIALIIVISILFYKYNYEFLNEVQKLLTPVIIITSIIVVWFRFDPKKFSNDKSKK